MKKSESKKSSNAELSSASSEENFSDVLVYFSKSLMNIDNEDTLLWNLAKNCISQLGFVDCVVYLLDGKRDVMIQKAAYGPKNPKDFEIYEPVERPLGFGIVGHVAKSGKPELIHDASKDDRYRMDDEFRYSEVCVPIIIDEKVIGIIDCEHPDKFFFSEHHLQMLLTISSITALKIKSLRTHQKYVKEQHQRLKYEKQLTELKLKALSTQLNPHFVFNAVNAIQYFITADDKKSAIEYLSVFSKLIRFYLKHLESQTVNLKDEIDMLHWYLKLQKLRYNDQFDYQIHQETESCRDAVIPVFIIQTLFENIIEHGIFNQYKNQNIQILFKILDGLVIVEVQYLYDSPKNQNHYKPEYRDHILKWQDQIRLLNKVKPYKIKKAIKFIREDLRMGGHISIELPNLKSFD